MKLSFSALKAKITLFAMAAALGIGLGAPGAFAADPPTITVNTQVGTITANVSVEGVSFPVTTTDVDAGTYTYEGTYTSVADNKFGIDNLPPGLSASNLVIAAGGAGTLTLSGTATSAAKVANAKLKIGFSSQTAESEEFTITVDPRVTYSVVGNENGHGRISGVFGTTAIGASPARVPFGSVAVLTAVPDDNYMVKTTNGWQVNSSNVTAPNVVEGVGDVTLSLGKTGLVGVTANTSVTVEFETVKRVITITSPSNGTLAASGFTDGTSGAITTGNSADNGSVLTVTATPTSADYRVKSITRTVNGVSTIIYSGTTVGNIIRTWTVSAAATFAAEFELIPKVTAISISAVDPAGILGAGHTGAVRGKAYKFTASVTAVGGASEEVTWSVDKKSNATGSKSTETVFSGDVLTIGRSEGKDSLTVTATSVFSGQKATADIKVDLVTAQLTAGPSVSGTVTADAVTHNSITVKTVTLGAATPTQEPEYAISLKSNNEPVGTLAWTTNQKFEGLKEGTVYYIYARSKESATHAAGTRSVSAAVRTLDVYSPSVFALVSRDITYSASGVYTTPKRPGLVNAALTGSIDSVYDVSVTVDGTPVPAAAVTNNKADSTVSFTLATGNSAGDRNVVVKYRARGKLPNSAGSWYTTEDVLWVLSIVRKELTPANIVVNAGVPVVYSGSPKGSAELASKFSVVDGAATLAEGTEWTFGTAAQYSESGLNRENAGTAFIIINGTGNYSGSKIIKEYAIERAEISAAELTVHNVGKIYDGTAGIDTLSKKPDASDSDLPYVSAEFVSSLTGASLSLENVRDYVISGAAYDTELAGSNRTLTALIRLNTAGTGSLSKNYRFRGGNGDTLTVRAVGLVIRQLTPAIANGLANPKLFFKDTIPENHFFNGNIRGLGNAPSFKEPIPGKNTGVTLKFSYDYPTGGKLYFNKDSLVNGDFDRDTLWAPRDAGTYGVTVRVSNGNTNIAEGTYTLGDYIIKPALPPVIPTAGDLPATLTTQEGRTVTLTVSATAQNGGKLRYQWFRYPTQGSETTDSMALRNDTLPTLSVVAGTQGEYLNYAVRVTNSFSGANPTQASVSLMSGHTVITVEEAPVQISGGFIVINPERVWTYTGAEVKPSGADVTVYLRTPNAEGGMDTTVLGDSYYELSYSFNTNVGRATLRATGITRYDGTITTYFDIAKKELARNDLTFTASRAYTGEPLSASVIPVPPKTGMGKITVTYDGDTTVPTNAGVYGVVANVAAGSNFTAGVDIDMGAYTIAKRVPDSTCFVYSIPRGHNTVEPPAKFGISFTGIKGTGAGRVTLTYSGLDTSEITWEARDYIVRAEVEGGDNYEPASVLLGIYRVSPSSVAAANRVVPAADVKTTVALAPVTVTAQSFSAGPSPASKAAGKIAFFSAKPVTGGSIYIFDASGNAAAKLKVSAGSGRIAEWAIPAAATEGAYVARGVLTGKGGTREKVSFVFAVTR
jgi:hypothetical protein